MSKQRLFNVTYIEYPETTIIYDTLELDISIYPELEGKSDQEVIDYIAEHAWEMKSTDPDVFYSLAEELQDMDIVREKIPHVGSEVRVEVAENTTQTNNNEDEEEDD